MLRFLLPALLLAATASAQPAPVRAIARACATSDLKQNLYTLAAPAMEGRRMGTRGDTLSARFVERWFRGQGLRPATGNSYYQAISATRRITTERLGLGGTAFADTAAWNLFPAVGTLDWNALPVVYPGNDTSTRFLGSLSAQDLTGKLVLFPRQLFRSNRFREIDSLETVLARRGAAGIVWTDSFIVTIARRRNAFHFLPVYDLPADMQRAENSVLPELALAPALARALLRGESGLQVDAAGNFTGARSAEAFALPGSVQLSIRTERSTETAPNVVGLLPGTDPAAPCIVVTAHRDHDGFDGPVIYPGAVDNASGTAALLQLAKMMKAAASKGQRPRRTIVFASVTGEERGLLGSSWYADHPAIPLEKTWAVLNMDMLGRVDTFYRDRRADSNYVYYQVEDSTGLGLAQLMVTANTALNELHFDDRYTRPPFYRRMISGSDQYPFFLKRIGFVYYHTGFCEDYHKPTDTPDKINYDLLTKQTRLAFLTLWNMANAPDKK